MYRKDFLDTNIVITLQSFWISLHSPPFYFYSLSWKSISVITNSLRFLLWSTNVINRITQNPTLEIPLLEIIPRIYFLLYDCVRRNIEENKKKKKKEMTRNIKTLDSKHRVTITRIDIQGENAPFTIQQLSVVKLTRVEGRISAALSRVSLIIPAVWPLTR